MGCRVLQLDLLEFKVIADDMKGGEWLLVLGEGLHMIALLV
jgi:hypothetical protein